MEQKQEFIALLDKGLTMTELCFALCSLLSDICSLISVLCSPISVLITCLILISL